MATFKDYYKLAKPGIIYGNLLTTIAAFFFAYSNILIASTHVDLEHLVGLFLATIIGISFVIGSGCVFNNYLDREIDRKMSRTKNRALVTGIISPRSALIYGTVLGVAGLEFLYMYVNVLTAAIALFGFITYVFIYGLAKRKTDWGAVIGSVPGAIPIVVGYTAVTGHLDATALILFLILVTWQMPHFYGIAIYRLEEYQAAGIPVLPSKKGVPITKIHIFLYILLYLLAVISLSPHVPIGFPRYAYLASVLLFGLTWLYKSLQGFRIKEIQENALWAKKVFLFSLIVLLSFSATIAIVPFL